MQLYLAAVFFRCHSAQSDRTEDFDMTCKPRGSEKQIKSACVMIELKGVSGQARYPAPCGVFIQVHPLSAGIVTCLRRARLGFWKE